MSRGGIQTPTITHQGIVSVIPQQFLTQITVTERFPKGRTPMSPYIKCNSTGQSVYITSRRSERAFNSVVPFHQKKLSLDFGALGREAYLCYLDSGWICPENASGEQLEADVSRILDVFLLIFTLPRGLGQFVGIFLSSESE